LVSLRVGADFHRLRQCDGHFKRDDNLPQDRVEVAGVRDMVKPRSVVAFEINLVRDPWMGEKCQPGAGFPQATAQHGVAIQVV
jgi:hypothetical protein